ncbi:LAME_0H11496g1_1 [Lachancea meyersii CBS 8951]|uniref:LAME_0H11496g1_1 n=1 Tax=Lachancea meyersii CBS 8951 TaxID=1266667 RepID=A0A1G4KGT0_9SACH|nr:LAME_0H11496g1_1 [Lachancea meyersii CBS 8951]
MRYLAGSAILVNVWTADIVPETSSRGHQRYLCIRAPKESSVARLLQYVHWKVQRDVNCEIDAVQQFCVKFKGRKLDPEQLVRDIDPTTVGAVTLNLEHCDQHTGSALNLDYDSSQDFSFTNLELELKVLSNGKSLTHQERGVPWTSTLGQILELATRIFNNIQLSDSNGTFTAHQYSLQGNIGIETIGHLQPSFLNIDHSNNDMQICDLLGFDFAPDTKSSCRVVFQVQEKPSDDSATIRFVSDAVLTVDTMVINAETTVHDVKDFICSVYGHSLRLAPEDVKLIYKGQLLRENTSSGLPSKALDYISERNDIKIHVHINQEYIETGPGFWNEVFSTSERFSFLRRTTENAHTIPPTPTTQQVPEINVSSASTNPSKAPQMFITESGAEIRRTGHYFEKVLISGQESFVQSGLFQPIQTFIELDGKKIELFPEDFVELRGAILLSQSALSRISSQFGFELNQLADYGSQLADEIVRTSHSGSNDDRAENVEAGVAQAEDVGRVAHLRRWTQTIMRTIYLILRNSVFFFVLFFQFSYVLRYTHLFLGTLLIIFKAVWSTPEIGEMWRELLADGREDIPSDEEIQLLEEEYKNRQLTRSFYNRFVSNVPVTDAIIDRLRANDQLRIKLAEDFKLDNHDSLQLLVPKLLEECISTQHDEIDMSNLHELFDPILKDVVEHVRDVSNMSAASKEVLKELRKFIYQKSSLPWHKSVLRKISQVSDEIYNGGMIRRLMPNVRPQVRGVRLLQRAVSNVLKLAALFIAVLIPRFQRQAVTEVERITAASRRRD